MRGADRLRARLAQWFDFEFRPNFRFIRSALERSLRDCLSSEDSESRKAVVIGDSLWLARVLGLKRAQILHLPYPDFTIENLALLGNEYDFVIADRILHRCESAEDAARETIRILRPGGCFVFTSSVLDFAFGSPINRRMLGPRGLRALFPHTSQAAAEGWGNPLAGTPEDWAVVSWIVGRKAESAPTVAPSVATRKLRRPWYRFRPRPAKFGVIAVARNEAPYLLEWIAHYRVLGFEQITIFDNQSNDASAKILAPLAKAGIINAIFWTDRPNKQRRAYTRAIRKLRPFVEWCLFVDLDEFLVLDPGSSLNDLLPADPAICAIGIPWRMYGSAGLRNRGTGLTIERFTRAEPQNGRHVKSLVRLRDVDVMGIHIPKLFRGRLADIAGAPIDAKTNGLLGRAATGTARINHYFNRSWEEFECKRARGRGAVAGKFHGIQAFDKHGPGDVALTDALRLAPAVREEIARLRKIVGGAGRED